MTTEEPNPSHVTRTYRAAIRLGEDFITLEETITLPLDASDEAIQQAVALGWRIYQAQHESLHSQITSLREVYGLPAPITIREPDAPASDKQRNYITALQNELAWTDEQLAQYAQEQAVALLTLNKGQASGFIDGLKRLAEERAAYYHAAPPPSQEPPLEAFAPLAPPTDVEPAPPLADATQPMTERQLQAVIRLSQGRGVDSEAIAQQHFGMAVAELNYQQASELIMELQRHSRKG